MDIKFNEFALEQAREDSESSKAKILSAAENLFATKGYKEATTREIADSAGVNIAMLHYHWGSKEELWNAVYYDLMSRAIEQIKEIISGAERGEPMVVIRKLIAKIIDFVAENPHVALLGQQAKLDEPLYKELSLPLAEIVMGYIEKETLFDFDPVENRIAYFCIFGAFNLFFTRPDLMHFFIGEDSNNYSKEFRGKLTEAIATLVERFGQVNRNR